MSRIIFEPKKDESHEAGKKYTVRSFMIFTRQNIGQCM